MKDPKKMTKAELREELERRPKGTTITDCTFDGGDYAAAMTTLAEAALANAEAIEAIANKAGPNALLILDK